jgi:pSer/pThr/pTyr-binding forkhead associated (FHA) protein
MRIELRILSGARAGESEVFEKRAILVGRKPTSDLRFNTHEDLDVSGDHAEFREHGGRWFVRDVGSTNGTYVNGVPIRDEAPIKDGDIIGFGKNGPTVEVRAKGDPTGKTPAIPRTDSRKSVKPPGTGPGRMSTHERVAVQVREQTRGIKTMLIGSMLGLGALAIAAYWIGTREGGKQVAEMQRILAQAESTSALLRERIQVGDTLLSQRFQRLSDSMRARAQAAATRGNEQEIAATKQEIEQYRVRQQGLVAMDLPSIYAQNEAAVAFLYTELDGEAFGGTAFGITKTGLMVTNRHNVKSSKTGAATTQLRVKFANTTTLLNARVVKVVDDPDLALIQIEQPGSSYPVVNGISAGGDVAVGAPLAMIGYPLSLSLPMEGDKASTTLSPGTTSKRISSLLQIDAFGAHGMSGSPVFDSRGLVVGVVYGGPAESPQIIFAVPSDRLAAFLGDAGKGIVR